MLRAFSLLFEVWLILVVEEDGQYQGEDVGTCLGSQNSGVTEEVTQDYDGDGKDQPLPAKR